MASNVRESSQSTYCHHFPCWSCCWPDSQALHGSPLPQGKSPRILARHSRPSPSCIGHWPGHPPAGPIGLCVPNPSQDPHVHSSWKTLFSSLSQLWSVKPSVPLSLLFWAPSIPKCTMPVSFSIIKHLIISTTRLEVFQGQRPYCSFHSVPPAWLTHWGVCNATSINICQGIDHSLRNTY